ncbi:zinc finger and SCAN domain-containing protein 30-like isoform X2 [Sceloporus undulatus]|uniref:zinc finger and SCAN domain-containing protein 30-like isoform X2 n=1 Tax=Sceloporus undulatus TaxID=8520 RepID=UPI001C4CD03D|nr:zinc finger and SCAN domain-containing protein 30-like isoform X2 [Sceloporus undulatus]
MAVRGVGREQMPSAAQALCFEEFPKWDTPHTMNQPSWVQPPPKWLGQWADFLKASQFHPLTGKKSEPTEPLSWEDPKAFLASFEKIAEACRWPREEWVSRLLPCLSGEAEEAFRKLEGGERMDYEKVKATILHGEAIKMEARRQRFRHFRYEMIEDPQRVYGQLQELCRQWLKPERYTKEEILDLVVLEQFLAILPQEIQNWIEEGGPEGCIQAVTLAEDFLSSHQESTSWKVTIESPLPCQEPLQDQGQGFSGVEVPVHSIPREICAEAKQKGDARRTTTLCLSNTTYSNSGGQKAEGVQTEAAMDLKALPEEGKTVANPTQSPMYWEVLDDEYRPVDFSGDCLIPKLKDFPYMGQEEIVFFQVSEDGETLPGRFSGSRTLNGNGNENSHQGCPEQRDLHQVISKECPGNISLGSETCDTRPRLTGQMSHQGKEEGKPTEGETAEVFLGRNAALQREKKYRCPEYGHKTYCISELAQHRQSHVGEKLYQCFKCRKTFRSAAALYGHLRIHRSKAGSKSRERHLGAASPSEGHEEQSKFTEDYHQQRRKKPENVCSRLLLKMPQDKMATIHEPGHGSETQQGKETVETPCEPIMLSEGQASSVTETATQVWVKKLLYSQRDKTCPSKAEFQMEDSPYRRKMFFKCSLCAEIFTNKVSLDEHQVVHRGAKLYECPICRKKCSRMNGLMKHLKIHTREKPLECSK